MLKDTRATVIGGHGFIGSALARQLSQEGWDCWVPEREAVWPNSERPLGHVFYCAGLTADYYQRPAHTVEAHVGLLARVLQSARYTSLVYLSSTRVYDGMATDSTTSVLATEDASFCVNPQQPRHFYDLTKLTGESLCLALGAGRARVARLACVYNNASDADGFLPGLLAQVARAPHGGTVQVTSSPHFARDYVHVGDVVRALVDIATHGTASAYNVASGENLRNDELAALMEVHTGRRIAFTLDQAVPAPVQVSVERLRKAFGWSPHTVAQTLQPWFQSL